MSVEPDLNFDLDIEDCRILQGHYANVMGDTTLLVELAGQRNRNLIDVFHDCKRANTILGNRIKWLESKKAKERK